MEPRKKKKERKMSDNHRKVCILLRDKGETDLYEAEGSISMERSVFHI